jgi:hypothetical protein
VLAAADVVVAQVAAPVPRQSVAPAQTSTPAETFVEALDVVDAELLVEVVDARALRELTVVEAGATWPVDESRPVLGSDGGWRIVVWVDAPLASPERVALAARALARRAGALTSLGEVVVVVADPAPRQVLAATRESARLEDALLTVASSGLGEGSRARRGAALSRARAAGRGGALAIAQEALATEAEVVRRQTDWLLLELERGCSARACALLWITDGWSLEPDQWWRSVLAPAVPPLAPDLAAPARDLARLAVAWGWTVWPLRLDPPSRGGDSLASRSTFDRWAEGVQARTGSVGDVVLFRVAGARPDPARPPLGSADIEALVTLDGAPLRAIADATVGGMLTSEATLDALPQRLARFERLVYRPHRRVDASLADVELAHRGAAVAGLRASTWSRASAPPEASELTLRRLLAGDDLELGSLQLELTAGQTPERLRVQAELAGVEVVELEAAPPRWRISWSASDGVVHHELAGQTGGLLDYEIPFGRGPGAVVVTELGRDQRGGTRVRALVP